MNAYSRLAMAVTISAAGLSLAACSAGVTSASPAKSKSPPVSHTASSLAGAASHTPSPSPAATVRVNAPIGSFPIPQGAKVAYDISCPKQISIILSPVTPSQASTFYTTALPRAGYKIVDNITSSDPNTGSPGGLVEIEIAGHGYTGAIAAMANLGAAASADPSIGNLPSNLTKNVVEITMSADGTPEAYICPS
jgi:hypothetical protein